VCGEQVNNKHACMQPCSKAFIPHYNLLVKIRNSHRVPVLLILQLVASRVSALQRKIVLGFSWR
jgi:hypothetical protein